MSKYGKENPIPGTSGYQGGLPKKTVNTGDVIKAITQAQEFAASARRDGTFSRGCRNGRKKVPQGSEIVLKG